MPSDYSTPSNGALKLKGAKDAGIDKKRKKKKPKPSSTTPQPSKPGSGSNAISKALGEENADIPSAGESPHNGHRSEAANAEERETKGPQKTAAEVRYEEVRRKRLDERLKREGMKTHKERVEELNKYLSNLSEHHDMPRIGPG